MAKRRFKVIENEEFAKSQVAATPVPDTKAPEAKKPEDEFDAATTVKTSEKPKVIETIDLAPAIPNNLLSSIMAFKTIYALCTIEKGTGQLKATHYAVCLVYGRDPMWGVFTVKGRLSALLDSKEEVERMYPKLTIRKKMSQFRLQNVDDLDVKKRRELLLKNAR